MRRRVVRIAVLFAVLCVLALPADAQTQPQADHKPRGPAGSDNQADRRPTFANFEGRKINLAESWEGAQGCIIWQAREILECYREPGEAKTKVKAINESEAAGTAEAPRTMPESHDSYWWWNWSCSGPLELYEHRWWGGRYIWFYDRGYWQNLRDYGFDKATSSYAVGPCYVHLAQSAWGGGWWYPGDTGPWAAEPYLWGSWDKRISSIYIE